MKKIISLILLAVLLCGMLAACTPADDTKVSIGVMTGPTGMGMAKLIKDSIGSEEYAFKNFTSPDLALPELTAGKLDMLCLPTNAAANLANKKSDFITVIAINTLGSLFLVTDDANKVSSFAELSGKTIYTSVPGSTTRPIIEFLLERNNIQATIKEVATHEELVALVKTGKAPIAVLPEPKITAGLGDTDYKISLSLTNEWEKVSKTPLTMGCIVVRNDFLKEHPGAVDRFLKDYESSIEFISNEKNRDEAAKLIVEAGILPKEPVALGALNNLDGAIVYRDGKDMTKSLKAFYEAIKLTVPADEFFYD